MQGDGASLDPMMVLMADREIRNLRARYWRLADMKEWEKYGELFAEDATWHGHAEDFHAIGRQEIVQKVGDVLADCETVHHGHPGEVYIDDDTHAHGVWVLEDYLTFAPGGDRQVNPWAGSTVRAFGHYLDTYTKIDGEWKIQSIDLYRLRIEQYTPTTFVEGYPEALRMAVPPRVVPAGV
jgi:hypothetical protein